MWYFQSAVNENRKFLVLPGKDYVIGRRDCDIVIENDQSVSRKHATLSVSHSETNVANVNKPASLTLKDVSKFGTFVNDHRVKGQKVLQDGDEVRFGTPKSIHRAVYEPFIVTTSCLDGAGKREVRSLVCQFGGHISSDWRKDCRYLVMKSVTVTVKVVCALLSLKPITTVHFLHDLLRFYKGHIKEKPQPEKYLPPVTDRLIEPGVSFKTNKKRSSVFLGMSFYFLSEKQFQKMNGAVELGGGVPILYDSPEGADMEAFVEDNAVVMNPASGDLASQAQKEWVDKVSKYLSRKGRFMVQDAEIGYAALYASTDTYCNPDKDVSHLLPGAMPSQSLTQSASLSSQQVCTQVEGSQPEPAFRKPSAPPPAKHAPGSNREADSSDTPAPKSDASQKTRGKSSQLTQGEGEDWGIDQKAFTVPETLTETVKSERPMGDQKPRADLAPTTVGTSSSLSETQRSGRKKAVAVKVEEDSSCGWLGQGSCVPPSETLPDLETPGVKEEGRADRKPILLLEDEEDDVVQTRKPPPSRNKRRFQNDSDDEDDPFDFVKKRKTAPASAQKTSPDHEEAFSSTSKRVAGSAGKSQHSTAGEDSKELVEDSMDEEDVNPFDFEGNRGKKSPSGRKKQAARSPSPSPSSKKGKVARRSPSPKNKSKAGSASRKEESEDSDEELSSYSVKERVSRRSPSPKPRPSRRSPSPKPTPSRRSPSPKARPSRRSPSPKPTPSRRSPSPKPTPSRRSPSPKARPSRRSPSPKPRPSRRSPSPKPTPSHPEPLTTEAGDADLSKTSSQFAHPRSTHGEHVAATASGPVPNGFLTTRQPIEDQVPVNPNFEKENIEAPAMVIQFEDLVHRQTRCPTRKEDQSDVPQGMMRWRGHIVPNFKKFTKTQHAGADRLPKIIGGRDLEEHCRSSNRVMDDWLKDLNEVESQQQEKDREAEKLFDFKPAVKGRKPRR